MMDFDERDLTTRLEKAGFTAVHLELQVVIVPARFDEIDGMQDPSWEASLKSSPKPLVPTTEEAMNLALTSREREQFMAHLQPLVEAKEYVRRLVVAYAWAVKR